MGFQSRVIPTLPWALAVLAAAGLLCLGVGCGTTKKKAVPKAGSADKSPRDGDPEPVTPVHEKGTGERDFMVVLPRAKQAKVNQAVERGVKYLKEHQSAEGRWDFQGEIRDIYKGKYAVGLTALPGLTLLECGVKPDDPVIEKAAKYVRDRCPELDQTYEISLAILFLDRLNKPGDKELIQMLAMRLVASQTGNGGWSYQCQILAPEEEKQLVGVLSNFPLTSKLALLDDPAPKKPDPNAKLVLDDPPDPNSDRPENTKLVLENEKPPPPKKMVDIAALPEKLKKLPVMKVKPDSGATREPQRSDNSNTQFATLALWAARRHGVPLDRTLALVVRRFRTSQYPTGGWGYGYLFTEGISGFVDKKTNKSFNLPVGTATMACAGLLGLAVGRGLAMDVKAAGAVGGRDRQVEHALKALGNGLARPLHFKANKSGEWKFNSYLLWSVERVGMLYRLKRIGGVDWYTAGTDVFLAHQAEDGSWKGARFTGSNPTVDTCFALLFLKRVNLMPDLTQKLTLDLPDADK
jgi:hypothetical protein